MALVFCPECGTQVSEHAQQCNKCSYPINKIDVQKKEQLDNIQNIDTLPKVETKEEEWKCINCGEKVDLNFDLCWNCGSDKNGVKPQNDEQESTKEKLNNSKNEYQILRTIASLCVILSWLNVIFVFFTIIYIYYAEKLDNRVLLKTLNLIFGLPLEASITTIVVLAIKCLISVLVLLGLSELIKVLLSIESRLKKGDSITETAITKNSNRQVVTNIIASILIIIILGAAWYYYLY